MNGRSRSAERKLLNDDKSRRSRSKERKLMAVDDDNESDGKKKKRSKSAEKKLIAEIFERPKLSSSNSCDGTIGLMASSHHRKSSKLAKAGDEDEPLSANKKLKRALSERGQRSMGFDDGGLGRASSHSKKSGGGKVGSKLAKLKDLQDDDGDDSGGRGRRRSKALSKSERSSSKDRLAKPPKRSKSKENLFRDWLK